MIITSNQIIEFITLLTCYFVLKPVKNKSLHFWRILDYKLFCILQLIMCVPKNNHYW